MYRLIYQDGDTPQAYTFTDGRGRHRPLARVPDRPQGLRHLPHARPHRRRRGRRPHPGPEVEERHPGQRRARRRGAAQGRRPDPPRQVPARLQQDARRQGRPRRGQAALRGGGHDHPQRRRAAASCSPTPRPARRGRPAEKKVAADVQEIEKSNRILKVLTKVAETLIAVRPVEEVLQQVMDIVFDHVPADRGFLMLSEDGSDKLIPMVVKHRNASSRDRRQDHRSRRRSPTASSRTASRS